MVVGREPTHRAGRLVDGEHDALGVVPAEFEEPQTRVGDRLGRSRVAHLGDELGSRSEWIGRNDDQFGVVAGVLGCGPVDFDVFNREARQVQVEFREFLCGLRGDRGERSDCVGDRVDIEIDLVVEGVVASVSQVRVEAVAQALSRADLWRHSGGSARGGSARRCRGGRVCRCRGDHRLGNRKIIGSAAGTPRQRHDQNNDHSATLHCPRV